MSINWQPMGRNAAVREMLRIYNSPPLPWWVRLWQWLWRRSTTLMLISLIFALGAFGQTPTLPDAPKPQPSRPAATAEPSARPVNPWRELRAPLIAMWAANTVDITQTCISLAHGGREADLSTQSCGGVVGILVGERLAFTAVGYWLARSDRIGFRRMGKILLWSAAIGSTRATVYSFAHWNDKIK